MQLSATDPPPRVLHVTQPVDGGVARVVTDLVRAQLAAGMRVTVACPADGALAGTLPGARRRRTALAGDPLARAVARARGTAALARLVRGGAARPGARAQRQGRTRRAARRARAGADRVPAARLVVRGGRRGHRRGSPSTWERSGRALGLPGGVRQRGGARDRASAPGSPRRWHVIPNGVDPERFHPAAVDTVRAGIPLLDGVDRRRRWWSASGGCAGRRGRTSCCAPGPRSSRRGAREPGSCWSGTGRTREALRAGGPRLGAVRRGRRPTPCPGTRPPISWCCRPAGRAWRSRPLEAMACGRPVVRHRRGRRPREPAAGLATALPGAAGGPGGARPRPLPSLLLDPLLRESRSATRAAGTCATTHDVRRTADAVADVYRELLHSGGVERPGHGRGTHRVQGVHPHVTAESTVPSPGGQPRATDARHSRPSRSSRHAPRPPAASDSPAGRRPPCGTPRGCRCLAVDGRRGAAGRGLVLAPVQRHPLLARSRWCSGCVLAERARGRCTAPRPCPAAAGRTARDLRPDRGDLVRAGGRCSRRTPAADALSARHPGRGLRPAVGGELRAAALVHRRRRRAAAAPPRADPGRRPRAATAQRVAAAFLRHPACGRTAGRHRRRPTAARRRRGLPVLATGEEVQRALIQNGVRDVLVVDAAARRTGPLLRALGEYGLRGVGGRRATLLAYAPGRGPAARRVRLPAAAAGRAAVAAPASGARRRSSPGRCCCWSARCCWCARCAAARRRARRGLPAGADRQGRAALHAAEVPHAPPGRRARVRHPLERGGRAAR